MDFGHSEALGNWLFGKTKAKGIAISLTELRQISALSIDD